MGSRRKLNFMRILFAFIIIFELCFPIGFSALTNELNDGSDFRKNGCIDSDCKCHLTCNSTLKQENDRLIELNCREITKFGFLKRIFFLLENGSQDIKCNPELNSVNTKYEVASFSLTNSEADVVKDFLLHSPLTLIHSLNLSSNGLTTLPAHSFFNFTRLEHLTLSNNNLTSFHSFDYFPSEAKLRSLDLSSNFITRPPILNNLHHLESLSLSHNQLTSLNVDDDFAIWLQSGQLKTVFFDHNDWICDNALRWFVTWVDQSTSVQKKDNIRCDQPAKATGMSFFQKLSVFNTEICKICECSAINKDAMSVNCSGRGLLFIPSNLPFNTKVVRLENNGIKNLSISQSSLRYWQNVTYLYLDNNFIESFGGIQEVKLLRNLVALHLKKNRFSEVHIHILDHLTHILDLHLSNNPWHCDCHTISFQSWLQQNFKHVRDVEEIRCAQAGNEKNGVRSAKSVTKFSSRVIYRIPKSELCPQPNEPIEYLDVINVLLAVGIILIFVKLFYDYWWQKRTGKLPKFFRINIR